MPEWKEYEPEEGQVCIPMSEWGPDHWSTLVYLETVAVDEGGAINNRRMRCSIDLHPAFVHIPRTREYPTRLRDGAQVLPHDDWSCLEDMVCAGLLQAWYYISEGVMPRGSGKIEFTDAGLELAAKIRAFKAKGGSFGTFVRNEPATDQAGVTPRPPIEPLDKGGG